MRRINPKDYGNIPSDVPKFSCNTMGIFLLLLFCFILNRDKSNAGGIRLVQAPAEANLGLGTTEFAEIPRSYNMFTPVVISFKSQHGLKPRQTNYFSFSNPIRALLCD